MVIRGTIFKVSYRKREDGQLGVRLLGRDTNGGKIDHEVLGTDPHFYVETEAAQKAMSLLPVTSVVPGPKNTKHRPTVRVNVRYPFDVPTIRNEFTWHGEADIVYSTRMRVDHKLAHVELPDDRLIQIAQVKPIPDPRVAPRVLYMDIECDDAVRFSTAAEAGNPILSNGFFDTAKEQFGVIYEGGVADPEAVRARILQHLPPGTPFPYPIRLFPVQTEGDVLGGFGELLRKVDPDVIAAWNGLAFDYPYLGGRVDRYVSSGVGTPDLVRVRESFDPVDPRSGKMGHEHRNRGRYALADPMEIMKKHELRQRSFSLEAVAQEFLGFGKVQRDDSVAELRRTDLVGFLAYNLIDVYLTWRIDQFLQLIAYAVEEANISSVEIEDIIWNSRVIDGTLLTEAAIDGTATICLPSKDFAPKIDVRGKGAEVFPPIVGVYDGLVALDLSGSYPNTTKTLNISPETFVGPGGLTHDPAVPVFKLPSGRMYVQKPEGLIPRSIRRLQTLRNQAKADAKRLPAGSVERKHAETVSKALKHVLASYTGVTGSPDWRLGDIEMFNDVTGTARLQLLWNKAHLEDPVWLTKILGPGNWTGTVVMGDTDSCYFYLTRDGVRITDPDVLIGHARLLRDGINASHLEFFGKYGATETSTSVEIEGVFDRFRTLPRAGDDDSDVGAKKRYYGLYAYEGETDVRSLPFQKRVKYSGIEFKRFNNAPITRTVQSAIVEMVLGRQPVAKALDYVQQIKRDVTVGKYDDHDLWIQSKWSGAKANQPHIRAMRNWSRLSGRVVSPGDEFHWAYVTSVSAPGQEVDHSVHELAIPLRLSLTDLQAKGWVASIDHEEMYRKVIHGPVKSVLPEVDQGIEANLEENW